MAKQAELSGVGKAVSTEISLSGERNLRARFNADVGILAQFRLPSPSLLSLFRLLQQKLFRVYRLRNSCLGLLQSDSWPSLYVSAQHEVCFLLEIFSHATNSGRIDPRFLPSMKFSLDLVHTPLASTKVCVNYSSWHGFLLLWASRFYFLYPDVFISTGKSNHYNDIGAASWALPN